MFWDSAKDNTIDVTVGRYYSAFKNMRATTPEGYRCDRLASSPVLFLGSCDINGPVADTELVWSRIIYRELTQQEPFPYIALSRMNTGADALVRRLNGYCEQYGPPKKAYIVLPRTLSIEVPIRGCLVSVSESTTMNDYLLRIGRLNPDEHKMCIAAAEFFRTQQYNQEFHVYRFEEVFAMLRAICERHNIEMRWTPNLAIGSSDYFKQWMEAFLTAVPWAAQTCAGVGELKDFAQPEDGSAGVGSQASMASVLMGPQSDLNAILAQLEANHKFLIANERTQYERMLRGKHA